MSESGSKDPQDNPSTPGLDLSQLQSFSFGTQWEESKQTSDRGSSRPGNFQRDRRPDSRPRGGGAPGGGPTRDRRPKRHAPEGGAQGGDRGERRFDDRGQGSRGGHEGHGPQGGRQRRPMPEKPYESPAFDIDFYPEDVAFSAVIKAMRANHLTYELFEIAQTFLAKPERFIASVRRKATETENAPKVWISVPDSMPFESEEEAIAHAVAHNIDQFFDHEEVEIAPPTGNFQMVNRCPFTKELLGPPNYHRYETALINHHRTRLPRMSFEKLQSSIETVREQEVIDQWIESMKKATRYTTKPLEGQEPKSFDSLEEATAYLKSEHRSALVKQVNYARVGGPALEKFQDTEAFRAADGELARQQRFPLTTANSIRGRLRREKFNIYKKGSKGVTFVCSTKRNFRVPGQVMAAPLDCIIRFLESHQGIKARDFLPAYEAWFKEANPETAFDEKKAQQDLHWLIADGYISHFSNDTLTIQPVLDNVAKHKEEADQHDDHEDHDEPAPAEDDAPAPEAAATEAPVETPVAETEAVSSDPIPEAQAAPAPEAPAETETPVASAEPMTDSEIPAVDQAPEAPAEPAAEAPEEPAEEPVETDKTN